MEAHLNLHVVLVMQGATTLPKEPLPVFPVILEATADLGRKPAHRVMPAVTTPRREALPNLPAFLVMQGATTLPKEPLPVFPVILEATAILDRQTAHRVMPGATIPS